MGTLFAHIRFHTTFCAAEKNRAFGRSVLISLLRGRNRKRDLAVGPIRLLSNPPSKKKKEEEEEEEEEHLSTFSHLVLSIDRKRARFTTKQKKLLIISPKLPNTVSRKFCVMFSNCSGWKPPLSPFLLFLWPLSLSDVYRQRRRRRPRWAGWPRKTKKGECVLFILVCLHHFPLLPYTIHPSIYEEQHCVGVSAASMWSKGPFVVNRWAQTMKKCDPRQQMFG